MIKVIAKDKLLIGLSLILLTGCPEWSSVPKVVDQNMGSAYANMIKYQTLCPEHGTKAKDSKLCPEHKDVMALDGQKAKGVIDAYRQPPVAPAEEAKKGVAFDVKNVGGSTN